MPYARIQGVNLYYEIHGSGFPVVLCHGYTGSHEDWAFQIPELSRKYRVLVMDHRGHGSSGAPPSPGDYSISIFARDVRELLEHLGIERCYLVGHSMGGFIALQFALDYPEKLSALVLMDTRSSGVGDVPEYVGLRRKLHQIAWTEGLGAAFEYEAARNPMSREYFQKYPEQREISRQKMLRTSVRGYVYAGEAILEWASVTAQLPRIAVPTLVIVGEEDKFLRQPCEVIAAAIPGARLVVIPGVGHSPQEEAPQIFNHHLLSFLSQVEQPAA